MNKPDYSKTVFSKGIVCYNTNNFTKCIVINGDKGAENDRCSLVIEYTKGKLVMHSPPNRALIPTGEYFDVSEIEKILRGD